MLVFDSTVRPDRASACPSAAHRRLTRDSCVTRAGLSVIRRDTGDGWRDVGPPRDASVLSGEHAEEFVNGRIRSLGFTGTFAGLWVWDLTGKGLSADFDEVIVAGRGQPADGSPTPSGSRPPLPLRPPHAP
ncbi:beta-xylosidase family glycoside hydrolase [Streptomyces scopuliridis]|uniref:beta-xylosidase family glycoside hydrolase n=1 Tax=Streptomyces scopuliridis TaxID=452529 RepID=UPI0035E0AF5B